MPTQIEKAHAFRALHERSGTFVIPNPWDPGSARLLASLGFKALTSTSAGFAFSRGLPDYGVGRDLILTHVADLAAATDLPMAADLENGFGDAPETVAETIRLAGATGIVGGSIEDATGRADAPIYPLEASVERVRAAVEPALPSEPLRFLCDAHLGATARLLRMAGFDTAYDNNYADAAIEALAQEEDWVILSRDRELLKRRGIRRGAFIRAQVPQEQMREIVARFQLAGVAKPFSRCLECNVPLRMLSVEEAAASVPLRVRERQRLFSTCDVCRRVYWPGSHWMRMNAVLAGMLAPQDDEAPNIEHILRSGSAGA